MSSLLIVGALILSSSANAQEVSGTDQEAVDLFNKGQDAHEKGDLRSALELYEKALKILPDFPEVELQRGNALTKLDRLIEAESAFRRAIKLRDDWSLAYASLGNLLIRLEKFDEAGSILKRAIELDPENSPAWVATAQLLVRTNASEPELRSVYKKIAGMAAMPRVSSLVLSVKAFLESALKEDKAAVASAERALEQNGNDLPMLSLLADKAIKFNDVTKADVLIRRIASISSNAPELTNLRARLLIADGKNSEALELINSVKEPDKELLRLKQQLVESSQADIPSLESKLVAEARNIVALSRLCSLLRRSDPTRALEYCRRASDVEPQNLDHSIGYAAALLQAKQYPQASALLQRLTTLVPDNYTVRANFASALFQQKRYTEAKTQFIWLTARQPSNAVSYYFLAIAHDNLGELPDAMANYMLFLKFADAKLNQLEIDKVNLRLPVLQKQLDAGKGRTNAKSKGKN